MSNFHESDNETTPPAKRKAIDENALKRLKAQYTFCESSDEEFENQETVVPISVPAMKPMALDDNTDMRAFYRCSMR